MKINELSKEIYETCVEKGFWDKPDIPQKLLLVITELAEAVEADRKSNYTKDRHCYGAKLSIVLFERNVKDKFEDELADALIRIMDIAYHTKTDLRLYYRNRPDLTRDLSKDLMLVIGQIYESFKLIGDTAGFSLHITNAFNLLLEIAEQKGIDIEWHIKAKMEYNKGREKLHGKRY